MKNKIKLNLNNRLNNRTTKQIFIIVGLIIIIWCLLFGLKPPESSSEYTGSYAAKVYENGKLNKKASSQSILVLNYEGDGSLVLNGNATNENWSETSDGIRIGDIKLIRKNADFEYTDSREKIKVIFTKPKNDTAAKEK